MSGGRVPYHLRPNKAVDRHVFIELLRHVHGYKSISKHLYVGFGGPFLEDFRLVHSYFGLKNLISLEEDDAVFKRQKFNKPLSSVRCLLQRSGDFISTYNAKSNAIIWLDYASPKDLRAQIEEMQALLPRLWELDIFKITVNANPEALGRKASQTPDERNAHRLSVLKSRIGDFMPNGATPGEMTPAGLASLTYRAILRAAREALRGSPRVKFLPVVAFRYTDAMHQMLTVAGVMLDTANAGPFLRLTGIKDWELFVQDAMEPMLIDVPSLSMRERLFIDSRLPHRRRGAALVKALRFWCGEDEQASVQMLDSYARFFRHYPYFSRVVP